MRTFTVALLATAAMGLATTALAQQMVNEPSHMQPAIPAPASGGFNAPGAPIASLTDPYGFRMMILKRKADRMTREDGGRLTPEHQAGLQKELDALNHAYRIAAK